MKCPRCNGRLFNNFGEVECVNCGFVKYSGDMKPSNLHEYGNGYTSIRYRPAGKPVKKEQFAKEDIDALLAKIDAQIARLKGEG